MIRYDLRLLPLKEKETEAQKGAMALLLPPTCTDAPRVYKNSCIPIAQRAVLSAMWQPGWEGVWGRMGTCICTAESLRCLPETITASLNSSVTVAVVSTQSCPALCKPRDCSPPGSSVHGILQARIPEWVDISYSRLQNSWLNHQSC